MAQKEPSLSISHEFGRDAANDAKGVFALVLIHALRSKVVLVVLLAALVGMGLVPVADFLKILPEIIVAPDEE